MTLRKSRTTEEVVEAAKPGEAKCVELDLTILGSIVAAKGDGTHQPQEGEAAMQAIIAESVVHAPAEATPSVPASTQPEAVAKSGEPGAPVPATKINSESDTSGPVTLSAGLKAGISGQENAPISQAGETLAPVTVQAIEISAAPSYTLAQNASGETKVADVVDSADEDEAEPQDTDTFLKGFSISETAAADSGIPEDEDDSKSDLDDPIAMQSTSSDPIPSSPKAETRSSDPTASDVFGADERQPLAEVAAMSANQSAPSRTTLGPTTDATTAASADAASTDEKLSPALKFAPSSAPPVPEESEANAALKPSNPDVGGPINAETGVVKPGMPPIGATIDNSIPNAVVTGKPTLTLGDILNQNPTLREIGDGPRAGTLSANDTEIKKIKTPDDLMNSTTTIIRTAESLFKGRVPAADEDRLGDLHFTISFAMRPDKDNWTFEPRCKGSDGKSYYFAKIWAKDGELFTLQYAAPIPVAEKPVVDPAEAAKIAGKSFGDSLKIPADKVASWESNLAKAIAEKQKVSLHDWYVTINDVKGKPIGWLISKDGLLSQKSNMPQASTQPFSDETSRFYGEVAKDWLAAPVGYPNDKEELAKFGSELHVDIERAQIKSPGNWKIPIYDFKSDERFARSDSQIAAWLTYKDGKLGYVTTVNLEKTASELLFKHYDPKTLAEKFRIPEEQAKDFKQNLTKQIFDCQDGTPGDWKIPIKRTEDGKLIGEIAHKDGKTTVTVNTADEKFVKDHNAQIKQLAAKLGTNEQALEKSLRYLIYYTDLKTPGKWAFPISKQGTDGRVYDYGKVVCEQGKVHLETYPQPKLSNADQTVFKDHNPKDLAAQFKFSGNDAVKFQQALRYVEARTPGNWNFVVTDPRDGKVYELGKIACKDGKTTVTVYEKPELSIPDKTLSGTYTFKALAEMFKAPDVKKFESDLRGMIKTAHERSPGNWEIPLSRTGDDGKAYQVGKIVCKDGKTTAEVHGQPKPAGQPSELQSAAAPGKTPAPSPWTLKGEVKNKDRPELYWKGNDRTHAWTRSNSAAQPENATPATPPTSTTGDASPAPSPANREAWGLYKGDTHTYAEGQLPGTERGTYSVARSSTGGIGVVNANVGFKAEIEFSAKAETVERIRFGDDDNAPAYEMTMTGTAKATGNASLLIGKTPELKLGGKADVEVTASHIFQHDWGDARASHGIAASAKAGVDAGVKFDKTGATLGYSAGASVGLEGTTGAKDSGSKNGFELSGGLYAGAQQGLSGGVTVDAEGNPTITIGAKFAAGLGGGAGMKLTIDTKPMREAIHAIDKDMSNPNSELSKQLAGQNSVSQRGEIWVKTADNLFKYDHKTTFESGVHHAVFKPIGGITWLGGQAMKGTGEMVKNHQEAERQAHERYELIQSETDVVGDDGFQTERKNLPWFRGWKVMFG